MKGPNHAYDDFAGLTGILTAILLTAALAVPVYFVWRWMTAVNEVVETLAGRVGL